MNRCKLCVNPDTRPNIFFDEEGVCPVCRFEADKREHAVDWAARDQEMRDIIAWARHKDRKRCAYDCIVTVSGGKDSTRQAFYARDTLGLNPLLVSCVYPPEQLHERGAVNLANLISHGFDTVSLSLNPQVWKTLMRDSFLKRGNWCVPTEMALYAIPVHVAIAYQIPLIFLGENPAWTIGEKHGRLDGDASQMRNCNTLRGGDASRLAIEGVTAKDLHFYNYPPECDVEYAALRIIYLGYYIRDWSGTNNAAFSQARGLVVRTDPPEKTGDLWGFSGLDEDFRLVNQMVKFAKFGFGHVTDQACEAINAGTMTREEGLELVHRFDGRCAPEYIRRYCDFLGITEAEFWEVVERFRDKELVEHDGAGGLRLRKDYA